MVTGKDSNGDVSINEYDRNQFTNDVKLMKDLGINSYRISISWARILPEGEGKVNEAGIDYYNFVINSLIMQGIKPLVTLYHLDMPLALSNKGGWMNRESVKLIAPHQRMGISLFKLSERFGIIYSWIRFSKDIMYGACLLIWSG